MQTCVICGGVVTMQDRVTISNIPGVAHKKCKADYDGNIISSGVSSDLTDMLNTLVGRDAETQS